MTVTAIVLALGMIVWIISVVRKGGKDSAAADLLDSANRDNVAIEEYLRDVREQQHKQMADIRTGDDADRLRSRGRGDPEDI